MKYYRKHSRGPILSFTLDTNQTLYCYDFRDIELSITHSANYDINKEITFSGITFKKPQIREIYIIEYPYDILPAGFCSICINLEYIHNIEFLSKIKIINENNIALNVYISTFSDLYKFDQEINLLNIEEINSSFLNNSSSHNPSIKFNSPIIFGNKLRKINRSFMDSIFNFNKPIILPDSLEFLSSLFMYNLKSFKSYIKISYKFVELCKKLNYKNEPYFLSFMPAQVGNISYKIKGLTEEQFKEFQKILPENMINSSYKRKFIYDGID